MGTTWSQKNLPRQNVIRLQVITAAVTEMQNSECFDTVSECLSLLNSTYLFKRTSAMLNEYHSL